MPLANITDGEAVPAKFIPIGPHEHRLDELRLWQALARAGRNRT